jgi:MFS family permease
MAASLAIWAVGETVVVLTAFALLFGLLYGGWAAILPAVVADLFGNRDVGTIIGLLYASFGIGTLVGPTSAGFAFDASGSYLLPIIISAGLSLIAAVLTALLVGPKN